MPTIDEFTTVEDGWALTGHFLAGNLLSIRLEAEAEEDGWESKIVSIETTLAGQLRKIAARMAKDSEEESQKVLRLLKAVEEGDLSDLSVHDSIEALHHELSPTAGDMEAEIERLFGKRE